MNTPTIRCYQTRPDMPGERSALLITDDGSQFAWAARPDDRRGASLIFDGLAATGVDWRVNPPLRVDIKNDSAHLVARLRVRGTRLLIITNAHYLVPPVRQIAIDLAARVGADLVFSYEDGYGTTIHSSGLLDDAERHDWACYPEDEPPFTIPAPQSDKYDDVQDSVNPFPPVISTVGFGLFRAWNRQLLTADQFTHLDGLYCDVYRHTRDDLAEPDATCVAGLAQRFLNQPTRAQAITALRAMQAALFRNGVLWRLPLSTLDAWRESPDSRKPTDGDYRRLPQLNDPQTAAIAVLASLDIAIDTMRATRLVGTAITAPRIPPIPVPDAALYPLLVAAELNDGALVVCSQRHISAAIRELTQQFGFPLPTPRGRIDSRKPLLDPTDLQLVHYRRDTE